MTAVYLLDTNMLIASLKGHPEVKKRLETVPVSMLRLSVIVLGELEFGAAKSAHGERNRERLALLVQRLQLVGIDHETIHQYGQLRALLERQGTPIGANDMWIAAQALSMNAVLVTDNEREFNRVSGLLVENWLAARRLR